MLRHAAHAQQNLSSAVAVIDSASAIRILTCVKRHFGQLFIAGRIENDRNRLIQLKSQRHVDQNGRRVGPNRDGIINVQCKRLIMRRDDLNNHISRRPGCVIGGGDVNRRPAAGPERPVPADIDLQIDSGHRGRRKQRQQAGQKLANESKHRLVESLPKPIAIAMGFH